jgi:predicted permease
MKRTDSGPSPILLRVVSFLTPRGRREEILTDLVNGFHARASRLGPAGARRHLLREVVSLVLWRLRWWRGARMTRDAAGAAAVGSSAMTRDLFQDLRFGVRTLIRKPLFAVTTVGVLGLGIGAPAIVLTLVDTIFFQEPARISEPDRIIRLTRSWGPGEGGGALGNPDYLYYRANASTLTGLAAYGEFRYVSFTLDGSHHDQLQLLFASDNFFQVLGVEMALGRGFLPEENAIPGTHPVAVLSHAFWTGALGGDPEAVGRTLYLNDSPYTVVGVAPEGFGSVSPAGAAPDAWVPIAMYGSLTRAGSTDWWERRPHQRSNWLVALGRMAPGVTFEAARSDLLVLGEALEFEGRSEDEGAFVQRQFLYSPRLEATLAHLSRMLLLVVGIVFLVAAFNVAVLLLSRGTTRDREMGIRTALGAGKGRLARQILVETLILGLAGGLLGLTLAFTLSDLAASLLPVPFAMEFRPDLRVVLTAGGLSLLTALGVSLFPVSQASRTDLRGAIHGSGKVSTRSWVRDLLVVGQVGLSLVLVAGALLFGRSFWTARSQELGFATANRLVIQVNLTELDLGEEGGRVFVDQALERIRAIPGVQGAAATRMIPFQGDWTTEFEPPPGARSNHGEGSAFTGMNTVTPDYFSVAGITILRGRALGEADGPGVAPTVVINQALAEALWPDQDPLGRTLPLQEDTDFEVVGVARNANYYELGEAPVPQSYLAMSQFVPRSLHFLIHTTGDAPGMAPQVQEALRELEPRLVFGWVTTMASVFEDETSRYEVSAVLVTLFSAVALVLAAAGLYGTVSFLVARRTREIGVRMALGAHRGRVAWEVMQAGLRLVVAGVVMGLAGAVVVRGFAEGLLFDLAPTGPLPLLGASVVLLVVAAVATMVPARHATRVDPMEAIRTE